MICHRNFNLPIDIYQYLCYNKYMLEVLIMGRLDEKKAYCGSPTYRFNVGDNVLFGHHFSTVVTGVSDDYYIYDVRCTDEKGNTKDTQVMWYDLRSSYGKTHFSNKHSRTISYVSNSVLDVIWTYHGLGIFLSPDYQRGSVWTDEDRERFLQSIFDGASLGNIILCDEASCDDWVSYECIDGRQRIETMVGFYENRIPFKGVYYNDLSKDDRQFFGNQILGVAYLRNLTYADRLDIFLSVNRAGVRVNDEHIDYVRKLRSECGE